MNANRMKYASTPTYGLQKRGLFKKQPAQREPETPDFSQAPEGMAPFPPQAAAQPLFSGQRPAPGAFYKPPLSQPRAAYSQPTFYPGGLNFPSAPQSAQVPFAAPSFIQPGMQPPVMQPSAAPRQPNAPQPLGNSAPAINPPGGGFSPRSQGYVPPAALQPRQQQQPAQPFMRAGMAPGPAVQPAPYPGGGVSGVPFFAGAQGGQAGPLNAGFSPAMPQGTPAYAPMPQGVGGMQQPPFAKRSPRQPSQREPLDADKLWTVFLFGLLPLLFIPTLFVPASLDVLRYLFLGLCVCGLGGMWYRQMFTSATRLLVSVVYVALCIVCVSMMMRAGRDVQQTGAGLTNPQSAQTTIAPDGDAGLMAAAPTEEPQSTPSPVDQGPSEAEQRLTEFMTLWQGGNTVEMVSYIQPSWASAQDNPSSQLFIVLANRTPEDFTIEDISGADDDNSRTVTMRATINKNNGKEPSVYRFMVIMVKESGEWYVDPNSLATNDEVKTEDENVVNAKQVDGMTTEAPRTTVTPVPPPSTKLYYNPNGGSYYHADPECESVRKEYLPLAGSFLYSELGEHKNLQPCLKCGAPTQELTD